MGKAIRNGDIAVGHTDILWNPVTGTVVSSGKLHVAWISVAVAWDIVNFPSHPHSLDSFGNPTNYQTHSVVLVGTAKTYVSGKRACLEWDIVNVSDIAWPDAVLVASQNKLFSS